MESINKNNSNNSHNSHWDTTTNESPESSISLSQYARYILIMVLGYVLVTCADEKVEPVSPPHPGSADHEITDDFDDFSVIREFDIGDMHDWENSSSQSRWQYFFVSDFGATGDYLNTTVLGEFPTAMYFRIPEILVEDYQEDDLLKITYKIKVQSMQFSKSVKSLQYSEAGYPKVAAGLEKENNVNLNGSWTNLDKGDWIELTQYFPVDRNGAVQPFFICQRPTRVDQLTIWWKDVRCYQVRKISEMP